MQVTCVTIIGPESATLHRVQDDQSCLVSLHVTDPYA